MLSSVADRDLDLNYEGTYLRLGTDPDADVHVVVGYNNDQLKLVDLLDPDQKIKRVSCDSEELNFMLPDLGLRQINGQAISVTRRISRQYRRAYKLNNLDLLSLSHGRIIDHYNLDTHTLFREIFHPTYPDLDFIIWNMSRSRWTSAALTDKLALVNDKKGVVWLFFNEWPIGQFDMEKRIPSRLFKDYAHNDIIAEALSSYNWG